MKVINKGGGSGGNTTPPTKVINISVEQMENPSLNVGGGGLILESPSETIEGELINGASVLWEMSEC